MQKTHDGLGGGTHARELAAPVARARAAVERGGGGRARPAVEDPHALAREGAAAAVAGDRDRVRPVPVRPPHDHAVARIDARARDRAARVARARQRHAVARPPARARDRAVRAVPAHARLAPAAVVDAVVTRAREA